MKLKNECVVCNRTDLEVFYKVKNLPNILSLTFENEFSAKNCMKGANHLTYCNNCGIIFNSAFDSSIMAYNNIDYNTSRSHSPVFRKYIYNLVSTLVNTYNIREKTILEIGCGDASFLNVLCENSNSKGFGFDPSYSGSEIEKGTIKINRGFYSEKDSEIKADVLVLRHVLEHIEHPRLFLERIIKTMNTNPLLFIEVPDFQCIAESGDYFEISMEHCNYFTKSSLKNLITESGMEVIEVFSLFDNKYIGLVAGSKKKDNKMKEKYQDHSAKKLFLTQSTKKWKNVKDIIENKFKNDFTVWGAGGRGVSFLNTLEESELNRIPLIIDMNEQKHRRFCAGVGKRIMPFSKLSSTNITDILIMNSIYHREISQILKNNFKTDFNLHLI
ncbi:MAG: class I SAM-dependent methyltransferase [Candidatus Hodarchaeales archaeon]